MRAMQDLCVYRKRTHRQAGSAKHAAGPMPLPAVWTSGWGGLRLSHVLRSFAAAAISPKTQESEGLTATGADTDEEH